jgi:hypothetical protein
MSNLILTWRRIKIYNSNDTQRKSGYDEFTSFAWFKRN